MISFGVIGRQDVFLRAGQLPAVIVGGSCEDKHEVCASCCDSGRRGLATTKTTKPEPPAVIVGGEGFDDKDDKV